MTHLPDLYQVPLGNSMKKIKYKILKANVEMTQSIKVMPVYIYMYNIG
jgi:hypothetical protein